MCGIAGYIGKRSLSDRAITATLQLMQNRGPDDRAAKTFEHAGMHITLLHSRLAIIDLDPRSNQPFEGGDSTLIFNGEIYNYLELRPALEKRGLSFRTSSDTEVLLHSYLEYGTKCVRDFEGMWAFALYDRNTKRLFLSRDRFGEKPLYYLETPEGFYFASEIKFLRALSGRTLKVNRQQLLRYLVNGYKALYKYGETFFEDVREVPSGTNAIIGSDLHISMERYFTSEVSVQPMSLQEAVEGVRDRLIESMKLRLRADVPLAFCLSGGVDSGTIASIAAKQFGCDVASFSLIDSDERYNEYDNIRATIDDIGCKNTVIEIPQERSFNRLRDLIAYHDVPIATITYYIHSFLSEAIAANGYKVVFSGTSSDELFTGYYDHFNLHLYEMKNHPEFKTYLRDWEEHIGKFVRNPFLKDPQLYLNNPHHRDHIYLNADEFASYLTVPFDEEFTEHHFTDSPLRNRMLNELFVEATPVILHEDDLNSMKYSLENRSPFLDSKLFQFAYSIPPEHLINNGYGKFVLREALAGILNDQVRLDRQKKGFNAAIGSVFDFGSKEILDDLLADGPIYDLVRKEPIEKLLKSPEPLPNSFSKFLFNFINCKFFLELAGTA